MMQPCDFKRHRLYSLCPTISSPTQKWSIFTTYSVLLHDFKTKKHFQCASKAKNVKTSDRDQRLSTHKMSAVLSHSINNDTRANIELFLKEKEEKGHRTGDARSRYSSVSNASNNWDQFYRRHRTNFFKDRHYMEDEFPELDSFSQGTKTCNILEAGCGVGNTVLPLVKKHSNIKFFATDFSQKAIQLLNSKVSQLNYEDCKRVEAFVGDISRSSVVSLFQEHEVFCRMNIVMMIFSMSAIPPERHVQTVRNVFDALVPGGVVLFRDYARCDHTQLKFTDDNRLGKNYYVRQDGTLTYFFQKDDLVKMFETNGFDEIESKFVERVLENRHTGDRMSRIWIHARFVKRKKGNV